MKVKDTRKYLLYLLLGSLAALAGLFTYWAYQPSDVFKTSGPLFVVPATNMAGGLAKITVSYCKSTSVPGIARTSYVSSSNEVFQPTTIERSPKGCADNVEIPVVIPKDLVPDTYFIRFKITYRVNPIKTVVEEVDTEKFNVVASN